MQTTDPEEVGGPTKCVGHVIAMGITTCHCNLDCVNSDYTLDLFFLIIFCKKIAVKKKKNILIIIIF